MKTAITNVLTFIGVIAILVALRGTEAVENVVASIHQQTTYEASSEMEWTDQDAQDVVDFAQVSQRCLRSGTIQQMKVKCTQREMNGIWMGVAEVINQKLPYTEEGVTTIFTEYYPDHHAFAYQVEAERFPDEYLGELDYYTRQEFCGDPETRKLIDEYEMIIVYHWFTPEGNKSYHDTIIRAC